MQRYNKRLLRPPKKQTPGRIQLKRKPLTIRRLFFRVLLAIVFYIAVSEALIFVNKWPRDTVYEVDGWIVVLWVLPGAIPAFFDAFRKTLNDPARRMLKEEKIKTREKNRRVAQAKQAATNAPGEINDQGVLGGAHT